VPRAAPRNAATFSSEAAAEDQKHDPDFGHRAVADKTGVEGPAAIPVAKYPTSGGNPSRLAMSPKMKSAATVAISAAS
jgi:hypothetical protein